MFDTEQLLQKKQRTNGLDRHKSRALDKRGYLMIIEG